MNSDDDLAHIPCRDIYQLYAYDLSWLTMTLPPGRCDALLDKARADPGVREHVLHSLLPTIRGYALRFHLLPVDTMELVSVGNLVLVENMREALLYRENPLAFLLRCAWLAMMTHFQRNGNGPITYPAGGAQEELPRYSYVHLEDTDTDLFDLLDASSCEGQQGSDESFDPAPLYEALDALSTDEARTMVAELFGLFGAETRTLIEMAGGDSSTKGYKAKKEFLARKLKKMRQYLLEHYPDFVAQHTEADTRAKARARAFARLYELGTLRPAIRQRLDAARAAMEANGILVTARALLAETHADRASVAAYLYELRVQDEEAWYVREARKQQQVAENTRRNREEQRCRLQQALNLLLERREPITSKTLAGLAHTGTDVTQEFLREWRQECPPPAVYPGDQRLKTGEAAAYLGVTMTSLRTYAYRHGIPHTPEGYLVADLDAYRAQYRAHPRGWRTVVPVSDKGETSWN